MAIRVPIVMDYNGKGVNQAEAALKKLAYGAGIAGASWYTLGRFASQATQAFIEDTNAQRQMAVAIRNNTSATTAQIKQQEAYIQQTQDTTHILDDQLRPAYAALVRWTKSTAAAQDLLNGSMDIAAGTGKDLLSVATAVGKAYGGNFTALKRLGVPIDESIVKSKDFAAAWRDLTTAFEGSQAAATKAKGAIGEISVAWADFKEQSGGIISKATGWFLQFGAATLEMANYIAEGMGIATKAMNDMGTAASKLSSAGKARAFEEKMNAKWTQMQADAHKKAAEAAAKRAAKEKELANTLQGKVSSALQAAQAKVMAYVESVRDAIKSNVSLADSYSKAEQSVTDKEDAMAEALKKRKDAYDALNLAQQTNDVESYNKALADLATAEGDVAAASAKKTTTYAEQFRTQVAAAKEFAGNLQKLIQAGLQGPGVAELLNMGAVAGNQVAKDLLSGTGGLSVGEVNQAYNDINTLAGNAAMATPGFGNIMNASVGRKGNNVYINVTAGVGNKTEIARQIVDALQEYDRTMGGVPIKVTN